MWANENQSFAGLTFVKINPITSTETMIITSIIISNEEAFANRVTIPITHIMIKTKGSKNLITKDHTFPTLKDEYSFNAGKSLSTPYIHPKIIH